MNMVDVSKIDPQYYKDSDYGGLFQYILDIDKPKDIVFEQVLKQMESTEVNIPLKDAKRDLDKYVRKGSPGTQAFTPWYHRWKKWYLDKTRFKDHELLD
jgi:hypothetical protein